MYGNYGAVKWDLTHPIQTAQSAYTHVRDYYLPKSLILSTERTDGEITKICVNSEAEETLQHQRQLAYTVGGPLIVLGGYSLSKYRKHRMLGNTLMGIGAVCAWWQHKQHEAVEALLAAKVVPPTGTEAVPITSVEEAAAVVAVEKAETAEMIAPQAAEDEGEAAGFYGDLGIHHPHHRRRKRRHRRRKHHILSHNPHLRPDLSGDYGGLYDDIPTMAGEFVTKYYWALIAGGAAWWFLGRKKK